MRTVVLIALAACHSAEGGARSTAGERPAPPRPEDCRVVGAAESLQAAIDWGLVSDPVPQSEARTRRPTGTSGLGR